MKSLLAATLLFVGFTVPASADSITAKEIAAGISDAKTEFEQEAWWDENMSGKLHKLTGRILEVRKGTFSGYWVHLDIGQGITVLCGMSSQFDNIVPKLRKGQQYTCTGYGASTWTSILGPTFSLDAG